jgi:hypothetical protein
VSDDTHNLPTLEQAKAAVKKAERVFSKAANARYRARGTEAEALDLQAYQAAVAALSDARTTYELVVVLAPTPKRKKEPRAPSAT